LAFALFTRLESFTVTSKVGISTGNE
jgi:hypothetical protein